MTRNLVLASAQLLCGLTLLAACGSPGTELRPDGLSLDPLASVAGSSGLAGSASVAPSPSAPPSVPSLDAVAPSPASSADAGVPSPSSAAPPAPGAPAALPESGPQGMALPAQDVASAPGVVAPSDPPVPAAVLQAAPAVACDPSDAWECGVCGDGVCQAGEHQSGSCPGDCARAAGVAGTADAYGVVARDAVACSGPMTPQFSSLVPAPADTPAGEWYQTYVDPNGVVRPRMIPSPWDECLCGADSDFGVTPGFDPAKPPVGPWFPFAVNQATCAVCPGRVHPFLRAEVCK